MNLTRGIRRVGLLLLAAAGTSALQAQTLAQYVAMGSSYAAGPGILPRVADSPVRCARSIQNYAHVLARLRSLSLVDVSCSSATTRDVLHAGQFSLPAQLDAVTPQTQLVTVTIGGNDVFYMANLMGLSCAPGVLPVCTVHSDAEVEARFSGLADSLAQIVAGVHQRSAAARVVFVTYFTVLPDAGTCARAGLSAAQAEHMRGVAAHLREITRQVAAATGSGVLDVATLSHGHDACAKDPWVLGAQREPGSLIPPFHPTAAAMQAVGEALNADAQLLK